MDYETIWLRATHIAAAAKYIIMIDEGKRNQEARDSMIESLNRHIDQFIIEIKEESDDE